MAEGSSASASTASDFTFLYSPKVGKTVEVPEKQEANKIGRKRVRNTDNWKVKQARFKTELPPLAADRLY